VLIESDYERSFAFWLAESLNVLTVRKQQANLQLNLHLYLILK
jgi:hypothetical protein